MAPTTIRRAALDLPSDERAALAAELLASLDEGDDELSSDSDWDSAWGDELTSTASSTSAVVVMMRSAGSLRSNPANLSVLRRMEASIATTRTPMLASAASTHRSTPPGELDPSVLLVEPDLPYGDS